MIASVVVVFTAFIIAFAFAVMKKDITVEDPQIQFFYKDLNLDCVLYRDRNTYHCQIAAAIEERVTI